MNITKEAVKIGNRYADEKSQKTSLTELEKSESAEDFSVGCVYGWEMCMDIISEYEKLNKPLSDFIIDYGDKYDD